MKKAAAGGSSRTSYGCGYVATDAPLRRRGPSADAHAGVVQAADGWVTTVDDASTRLDVAPADDAKA